ncbi:MAG: BlaI/MecI/CopY family transcriptional regulator [Bacteroidota bacterium]
MRKKPSLAPLGESELELLQLVWETGPATVSEIHDRILPTRKIAYTTVMSALRKLADKGYLQFKQEGNAYVYSTARPPQEVKHNLLSSILKKVFLGSPVELVESLVKHESLSPAELDAIKQLIEKLDNK